MLEIVDVAQMREQVAHDIDDRIGTPRTLRPVFDRKTMIDHLLYIAPVLGQYQTFLQGVVFCNCHNYKTLFLGSVATNSFR